MPVTQPGSAVHQKMSPGFRSSAKAAVAWCATTAPWTWRAPLGLPVVPLVKCSSAGVSGLVGAMVHASEARSIHGPRACTPGEPGGSSLASTSSTWRSSGSSGSSAATFLRNRASVVTSTLASPSESRARMGSGPKAEKSGQNTSPCLSAPNAAT